MPSKTLLLLPGMTPDERIFSRLRSAVDGLQVATWLQPQRNESIRRYARRLADSFSDRNQPCYVGGVSFGGIVALELACLLPVRACFLISSITSPAELPPWMRAARILGGCNLDLALRGAGHLSAAWPRSRRSAATVRMSKWAGKSGAWHRWATAAVLRWRPHPAIASLKIHRIHGALDRTFPSRYIREATFVPTGGHVLPLTHPEAVTSFLIQGMSEQLGP
jgi:pimeloyl-ACP methyl ester carboxylesterase